METVTRNVQIKILAQPPKEAVAAFKAVSEGAKAAGKSVRDIQATAVTTTDKLRKMWSDTKDQVRGAEVQVNRLARAIKDVGLSTADVTRMAKAMGQEWKLTAAQIDQALAKAGRAKMGGGGGGGFGGLGWGALGGGVALGGIMNLEQNISNKQAPGWLTGPARFFDRIRGINPDDAHGQAGVRRAQRRLTAYEQREAGAAERLAITAPERATVRNYAIQSTSMRDDIAGMGRLDPLARQRAAGLRSQFGGTLGGLDVFGKAGAEFARAQSERFQDVTKSGGRAAAQAELALGNARAERGRAVAEQGGIRQQLAGAHPSEVARIADLNQQLVAASTRRKDAEAAIVQAMRQQQQVGQQNLGTISEMAKQAAEFARQQAKGAREKFGADVTALGYEDPEKIRALRDVAERLKGGRDVDPEMLRMARGAGLGLGDMTDARAKSQALANPDVQALIRATGIQRKVEDQERQAKILAEVAVRVEQKLETKVEMDAASVAKQLADNVLPAVHKLMQDTIVQLRAEAAKARVVSGANRNAAPP